MVSTLPAHANRWMDLTSVSRFYHPRSTHWHPRRTHAHILPIPTLVTWLCMCATDMDLTPNSETADDSSAETPDSPPPDHSSAGAPNSPDASAVSGDGTTPGTTAPESETHSPATSDGNEENFPPTSSPAQTAEQSTTPASHGQTVRKNRFPTKEEMQSIAMSRGQHSSCFVAGDAVRWMVEHDYAPTIINAVALGQVRSSLCHSVPIVLS